MIKVSIHQEDIKILNVYITEHQKKLTKLQAEIDKFIITFADLTAKNVSKEVDKKHFHAT